VRTDSWKWYRKSRKTCRLGISPLDPSSPFLSSTTDLDLNHFYDRKVSVPTRDGWNSKSRGDVPTQFSWPLESTPLSPGSSLYRPPQSLSLFPRGRAPSRNRLPQPPAPPSLAHLRKPATVSPLFNFNQATTTTTLRPTKRPVCFVSLCFLTSTRHNYSSTSHSSFDHASSASFISFMVLSSSLLVFCVEDTFISTFCRVSTGLGMFVSILINSPVVDTTKQAIYLPVSLSLSRPPRLLVVSFIVEASLSSLVIVVVVLAIVSPSSRSSSSFSPSVLVSSSSSRSPPPSPRLSLSAAVAQLYRYSPLSLVPSSPPVRISRRYLPLSRSSRNPLALSALLPRNSTTATGHRPPLTHPHLADFPPHPGVSTYTGLRVQGIQGYPRFLCYPR